MRLARDGYYAIGTATTGAGVAAIDAALSQAALDGKAYSVRVDDNDSVAALIECLKRDELTPLVLVNNAGVARDNLLMRMSETEWQDVIDTNLSALYRLCRPLLRGMTRARWGRIVNVSSVVGRMGNAGQTNYAATKAGIEGFTRALAQEVGSRAITVNSIAPGLIETEMTANLTDEQRAQMLERVALRRLGTVDDVAAGVAFLVSDQAAYITGETLHVNGGLYMA